MAIYNFSAGPALLPQPVLKKAKSELLNYKNSGMSVMELSHRSTLFDKIIKDAEQLLRELMSIPDHYYVLFLQGGASLQFTMVPLNLARGKKAQYVHTGSWSKKAMAAAEQLGNVEVEEIASSKDEQFTYIPKVNSQKIDPEAAYVHITTNNTIEGTAFFDLPDTGDVPLVADMSSNILANEYDVNDFGLIYAGTQKNIAPAGLTVVIIREDLVGLYPPLGPMLDYKTQVEKQSLYNTPPTFNIYMAKMVFEWLQEQGGVAEVVKKDKEKASLLYNFLDRSSLFDSPVRKDSRSLTNVPFVTHNQELDQAFIEQADKEGFKHLKGHRTVGGMRASLYNAFPEEGVQALITFMKKFEEENGGV